MKKQILSIAILILISSTANFAQTVEQQVTKIRNLYAATNKRIDKGIKEKTAGLHYAMWTVGGERDGQQWSAVGTMETRDEIWFDGEPDPEGGVEDVRKLVRKIVSSYKGAAGIHTRSEYLFNENGELLFAYSSNDTAGEDGTRVEEKFYFAKGKLIRVVRDGKNVDAKFSAKDFEKATGESENGKRARNKFAIMFAE